MKDNALTQISLIQIMPGTSLSVKSLQPSSPAMVSCPGQRRPVSPSSAASGVTLSLQKVTTPGEGRGRVKSGGERGEEGRAWRGGKTSGINHRIATPTSPEYPDFTLQNEKYPL